MNENISLEEDLYTIVNNDVLKDKTLSMQAKGLYAYLRSNSKDWKLYKTEVYNHFTNGRDAINKAWKELVDTGWIVSKRIKTEGKMDGWHHEVKRTTPPTYWKSVNRESRQSENPQLINNNNNKYQSNNNTASGDAFWLKIRNIYKEYNFKPGNKQQALSEFKKLRLDESEIEHLIKNTDAHLSNKRKILDSGEFVSNPPHVVRWIKHRGWEDELDVSNKNVKPIVNQQRKIKKF